MPSPTPLPRRRLLLAGGAAALLAACGGGGGHEADAGPAIEVFSADRARYFVGERARLQVRYRGESARIDLFVGEVASGVEIVTEALGARTRLRLVVSRRGWPDATRELLLEVDFRDRWTAAAPLTTSQHAAVTTMEGELLVTGGSRGLGIASDAVDRWDPASGSFRRIATLATGRLGHSAVALGGSQVLVLGGQTASPAAPFAELVDAATGRVEPAGTMVRPRSRHAALRLGDGRVLAVGGSGRNSLELWEPATRQWRAVAMTMAHERQFPTATELPDGRVLIAGGLDPAGGGPYVFAELFDPRTEVLTPLPQAFAPRQFHAAHRCSDGTVLILGGEEVGPVGLRPTAEVLRYDPVALRFGTERPLAQPRTLAATVRLPQDEVLLVGGEVAGAEGLASPGVERWSREGGGRAVAALPEGRSWHSAARLLDGRILVVGGEQADGRYVPSALLYE